MLDLDLSLQLGEVSSLLFHPEEQMMIAGGMNGELNFCLFENDVIERVEKKFRPKKNPIRCLEYLNEKIVSADGEGYICLSSFDPKVIRRWKLEEGISSICALNNNIIVAGHDDGQITGIDVRVREQIFSVHEQTDFVSSIVVARKDSPLKAVVATSGDCTLAVFDFRSLSDTSTCLVAMSDEQEDEMNCSLVLNSGQHVITGSANGVVGIWKQGYWGDVKDRLPLYNKGIDGACSIEYLKKVDEKRFIATTPDGIIRLMNLYPNTTEALLGVHRTADNKEVGTVSAMDCDPESGLVATSSGDGIVKFWKIPQETTVKTTKPQHQNPEKASRQGFFGEI